MNNVEPDEAIFSCRATSQEAAEEEVRKLGHTDFFLSDIRELTTDEGGTFSMAMLRNSPYLGKPWASVIGVTRAIISKLNYTEFVRIHTYGRRFSMDPGNSPYVQILRERDGSVHVEISDNEFINPKLSTEELELLRFLGWQKESDQTFQNLPNPYRNFEAGYSSLFIANCIVEALVAVYKINLSDYFNFGESWQPEFVAQLGTLERVDKAKCNPKGSIFRAKQDPQLASLVKILGTPYELLTDSQRDLKLDTLLTSSDTLGLRQDLKQNKGDLQGGNN